MPALRPEYSSPMTVTMNEWDRLGPAQDPRLSTFNVVDNPLVRQQVGALRGRVDLRQGLDGVEITTNSFVGRVDVGPLRIVVRPKLQALPLTHLLRYAYGLRDVAAIDETRSPMAVRGIHDLLIAILASEVEELLHRGLARRYIRISEKLESPRGRILVDQVIRQGGVREARLPCAHFDRHADWHLNRVLQAGAQCAALLTEDRDLRQRMHRIAATFPDVGPLAELSLREIERAERDLTRLTAAARPALTVIRLLQEAQGVGFDPGLRESRVSGFLFDMNIFFQRLLSRFLHENLSAARIEDERVIRKLFTYAPDANPRRLTPPAPRPDYALYRENVLSGFMDAKYRDLWQRSLPPEWLYQLSIYALASPSEISILLYASMSQGAKDERIEIRQPVSWSVKSPASIIIRPVPLDYLAQLVAPNRMHGSAAERRHLAQVLVAHQTRQDATRAA